MSAGNAIDPRRSVLESLLPFRHRAWMLIAAESLLWLAAGLVLALLTLLWLDTVVAIPASWRWLLTRPVPLLALVCGVVGILWRFGYTSADRLARRIDEHAGTGGEVLTGLQLEVAPVTPAGELSQSMARMASVRSSGLIQGVAPGQVFTIDQLRRSAAVLAGGVAVSCVLYLLVPTVAWHQLQRFLFPAADIPAYTGIILEVQLEKSSVLYGQDAIVDAVVMQGNPRTVAQQKMMLVVTTADGRESILPMLAQSENQWQTILTRITEPVTLVARSGSSVSRRAQLDVIMTPQLLPPKVTITPPEYTRKAVYRGGLPDKGLIGLAGTQIDIELPSNRPLAEGRCLFQYANGTAEQLTLAPMLDDAGQPTRTAGSFLLTKSGQFELSVVDVDGIESQDRIIGSISITTDQRPIVRIVQPKPMSLATPDIQLPVAVLAEDDFGLSSLTLFRSLNGSTPTPVVAELDDTPRQQVAWQLPLPKYGLQPGDELQFFARVEDNDPAGAKGAESPVTTVKIISIEEFQEMMMRQRGAEALQAKYQQARRYFDQLAAALREVQEAQEQLEKADTEEARQQLAEKLAAAEESARQAAAALEKLSQQAMPIDIDQQLAEKLGEMSKQAAAMAEQLAEMPDSAPSGEQTASEQAAGEQTASEQKPLTASQMQELQKMLEQAQQKQQELTEQAIAPMQQMQKMMPLIVAEQRFVQITQQQRDLSERLKALAGADQTDAQTQRRIAELEAEQEQLRQGLNQLLDDIERSANELGEDEALQKMKSTALEFAQAVRESQAAAEMADAQQQLLGEGFEQAQQHAQSAAEILESFLSQCNSMGQEASGACERGFQPSGCKMGNSINQMLSMMGNKPGTSGSRPGGNPGMGFGWGAGGGYAQRFPSQQNVGLYGSLPLAQNRPQQGQGDNSSGSVATSQAVTAAPGGDARAESASQAAASGQAMNSIPTQYRSQVAEYYRTLAETLGEVETQE